MIIAVVLAMLIIPNAFGVWLHRRLGRRSV